MDTPTRCRFPLAVALLAGFGQTAQASDEAEIYRLITPESTISSFGVGYVGNHNQYFGEYNGLNSTGAYALLDAYIVKRDNETGTWYKFTTRNLGLEDRDIRWEQERQGDWGYSLEYSQIPRYNPFTITTGLAGIGGTTQQINGVGAAQNVELKTERKRFTLDLNKYLPAGYDFQVRYRHEDKTGSRMYGQGTDDLTGIGDQVMNFLTEPLKQTTQQVDAILNYTGESLQLSGGYYGTWFSNSNPALNVIGGIDELTPMALPPGNQSHQAHLTGGYNFTPTTRGTFKAAYTHQIQNQAFINPAITGTSNLDGRVDTTLVQAGLTSRPMPKLSVLADFRYQNRDDKTPVFQYFTDGGAGLPPNATTDGTNQPNSLKTISGKLEASYQLPMGFRFTGGGNYVVQKRNVFPIQDVSTRDETDTMNYRAELRRAISETVTGALSYVRSDRWGSNYVTNTLFDGSLGRNNIAPLNLANRTADTVKLTTNWMPTDNLSFQIFGSGGWVDYSSRNSENLGLRSGQTQNYGADATYVFTEKWHANAWYSRNDIRVNQATCAGADDAGACFANAAEPVWKTWLHNVSDSVGVGVKGKVTGQLEVGTNLEYSNIRDYYPMAGIDPAGAPTGDVPGIHTQVMNLKLFAKYAVRNNMGFRFNYIYNHFKTNDWTWTQFVYSDGTQVMQNPNQVVNFFGLAYYYTFQ